MDFLTDLVRLFNDDVLYRRFIKTYLNNPEPLFCTHILFKPTDKSCCHYYRNFGTNDIRKGMVIRKSTIWSGAHTFLNIPVDDRYPSDLSTKVDICQLLIPLVYPEDNILLLIQEIKDNNWVVLHGCGCGVIAPFSCTNIEHLTLGNTRLNNRDTGVHILLKACSTQQEYDIVIKLVRQEGMEDTF